MKSKIILIVFFFVLIMASCAYGKEIKEKFTLYLNDASAEKSPEPMSSALFLLGSGTLITRIVIRKKQKA